MVVGAGEPAPADWDGIERVVVEPARSGALPMPVLDQLQSAQRERRPLMIELHGDTLEPVQASDEIDGRAVWSVPPGFAFPREEAVHAIWANALDARGQRSPSSRLAGQAQALGATAGGPADVVLPDGRPAFVDGGPLAWFDPAELDGAALLPRVALEAGLLAALGPNDNVADLAPDQLAAVTHPGGTARIIAPAGSGKTRVLTERARHLLRRWGLPGGVVCLVAFNRRAAGEMVERTSDLPELQVRTLNALGLAIATADGGGSRVGATIDERAVRDIIQRLVTFPRRAGIDPVAAWIEALSAVRLGLRSPAEVEDEFNGDVDGLPEVFDQYRAELARRGALDFDDQIYRAIEILLTDPAARARARRSCRLLLVDELQDLTPAHILLIRLLAGPDGAVFGVGDDDQTIYGYSGASPDWLIRYSHWFPGAGDHPLEVNYRCPPRIVQAAATLLTHNQRRVSKTIRPASGRPEQDPRWSGGHLQVLTGDDPVAAAVDAIRARLSEGAEPHEVAVLTRVNTGLAPAQVALIHAGVPVVPAVGEQWLERTGVRSALAWMRLAQSPRALAGADVVWAARRPPRGMSPKLIEWMGERRSLSALRTLGDRLGGKDQVKVDAFASDVEHLSGVAEGGTSAGILRAIRDSIGLDAAMAALDGSRRRLDRSPQSDDLAALVALGRLHPEPATFEAWLRQSLRAPGDPAGVVLATIHSVKGREWPHVVVHDATAGLLPHRLAEDVEEERRVFHVAITRAIETVTITAGEPPSPFLAEMHTAWDPARARRRPAAPAAAARAGPALKPVASATPRVEAVPGLVVQHQGYTGPIEEVIDEGAVVRLGRATTTIPLGTMVRVDGRLVELAGPPPAPGSVEAAEAALRAWRSGKAKAERKPAYVFLADATLLAIAEAQPRSLAGLATIKGIGQGKLTAFGDELLAVLDDLRPA